MRLALVALVLLPVGAFVRRVRRRRLGFGGRACLTSWRGINASLLKGRAALGVSGRR